MIEWGNCAVEDCLLETDGGTLCIEHMESHDVCSVCDWAKELVEMYVHGPDEPDSDQALCLDCAEADGRITDDDR